MDQIGAEVGQKMRSAIKAKLLELNCYVDDELPDYIMVMVANKRTKMQMNEDLNLFLSTKTSTFVDWLHIVLKRLKEVTVTNPEVYKKAIKRKSVDTSDIKVKKERKYSSLIREKTEQMTAEQNKNGNNTSDHSEDGFDIPLLSQVNIACGETNDLSSIEKQIRNVKSRLGLLVDSDLEEELPEIKTEVKYRESKRKQNQIVHEDEEETMVKENDHAPMQRKRITFDEESQPKRQSILERLGSKTNDTNLPRKRISLSKSREDDDVSSKFSSTRRKERRTEKASRRKREISKRTSERSRKESILSRLGVMSKVLLPPKEPEEPELDELKVREVRSMVRVKPRVIPTGAAQPNKNLLLKAVAEAQKSIAQRAHVGTYEKVTWPSKPDIERLTEEAGTRKFSQKEKNKLKNLILSHTAIDKKTGRAEEYIPKPVNASPKATPEYVPSSRAPEDARQHFIVTLDGVEDKLTTASKLPIKSRLDTKRRPSPIIYNKARDIPDALPIVKPPPSVKNKERCKFWPGCRQGDKCEFIHPSNTCEAFPHCKFGEKCLYLHPACKFSSSCTKRGCPYNHSASAGPAKTVVSELQACKFFPNCSNSNCQFYHPKLCKFGKYCKRQAKCSFVHQFNSNKASLTWRSK